MSSTNRGGADYAHLSTYLTPPELTFAALTWWRKRLLAIGEDPAAMQYLCPYVGAGAWLRGLYATGYTTSGENIEVHDLNPDAVGLRLPGGHVSMPSIDSGDRLNTGFMVTDPQRQPDAIVDNPPFGIPRPCANCAPDDLTPGPGCDKCRNKGVRGVDEVATAHVERSLDATRRHVLFLLSVGFLGGRKRSTMWPRLHLRHTAVLVPRVPFSQVCEPCGGTGAGPLGDCSGCGGSGWDKGNGGTDSTDSALFWFDLEHTGDAGLSHLVWRS